MVTSPRPQNTSRTVTGTIRRRDNTPISNKIEIRVRAFDLSPNGEIPLSDITPTTSTRTYLIAYNFSPTPSRKNPNLIVKAFDYKGTLLGVSDPRPNASLVENNVDILIGTQPQPTPYRIAGQVKTTSTNQTFPGVKVEATFRRENQTLLTRNSTTDANSNYALTFDSTLFPNPSQASGITVFFQVYQNNQRLDTDTVIQNLQAKNYQQDMEIKPAEEFPSDRFIVRGTIRYPNGNAAAGMLVQAFDKDMLRDEKLGEQLTNPSGQYEISYTRAQFSRAENLNADVFIRVSHPHVPDISLGESGVIYHAQPIETINLTITRTSNEFEQHKAALDKIREERAIADFTPDNIEFAANETFIPRQRIELLVAAFGLFQQTGMAAEVFYGIGRQLALPSLSLAALAQQQPETLRQALVNAQNANIIHLSEDVSSILSKLLLLLGQDSEVSLPEPVLNQDEILNLADQAEQTPGNLQTSNPALFQQLVDKAIYSVHQAIATHFEDASYELKYFIRTLDLKAIATPNTSIPSFLANAIRTSPLPDLIQREGLVKLDTWETPQNLNDILQPDIALRNNPLFANEFRQADVFRIGTLTQLSNAKVQQLVSRGFSLDEITPDNLTELVNQGILTNNEAQQLGFNANLYQLSATNLNLVNALKTISTDGSVSSLKDLTPLTRNQWENLLEQNEITPPNQANRAEYAAFLHKQIEVLYPNEVFRWQHQPINENRFIQQLDQIAPLFAQNPRLFNGLPFSTLNLENIDPQTQTDVEVAYQSLNRIANRYSGLELAAVLDNRELPTVEKLTEASRRVNLMEAFYQTHETTPFLFLDYSPDSDDVAQLDFANYSDADKRLVLNNLKADQRIYRLTQDAEHTFLLKENGYHAAYQIASDSFSNFVQTTDLPRSVAAKYFANAQDITIGAAANFGTIFDIFKNPLWNTPTDNTSDEIRPYLQRLEGYSTLFGNQDFCKCKHCQSIISPAAYFVDLMDFLKKNVLDKRFTGSQFGHILNPYNRRRDLWETLPLTCQATHELMPYLTIILEVLENYIVTQQGSEFTGAIDNRDAVENFVYERLYTAETINSFRQPFHLPLVELQTYLQHFPTNRAEVARTVLAYQEDINNVIPQAELGISRREYNLIQEPNTNDSFLNDLYPFQVPLPTTERDLPESKQLLHVMEISRQELTELVNTKFVTPEGTAAIEFRGRVTDGSVQINREIVVGLNSAHLDRMHRFVRLWRRLDWSIDELDQVLQHIYAAGLESDRSRLPLPIITQLQTLQKHLKVSVPELCALFHEIPNDSEGSLCDRLFNLPVFTRNRTETEPQTWPNDSEFFRYPYPAESADPAATQRLHRLLAGLGLKDDELFQLIENLRIPLTPSGGSSAAPFNFPLNLNNLSLLYRHARLAKLLKRSIPELFVLLRLSPDVPANHLENLATLQALVDVASWQKASGYSIRELATILADDYGSIENDENSVIPPNQISESLIEQILTEQSLIFADTVFAYFEGITEAQSQAIIRANPAIIIPADIRSYRITASVTEPATVGITLPSDIESNLNDTQRNQLIGIIREIIATYRIPGAPDISDRILVGTVGLTLAQSRAILGANPGIFERVETSQFYWLSSDFNPDVTSTRSLTIPADIPLRQELAHNYLLRFYASEVVAYQLGRQFNLTNEKAKALSALAGYNFSSNVLGSSLTRILHNQPVPPEETQLIPQLVSTLQILTLWFKDRAFDENILTFVQSHSGGATSIFQITVADYRRPRLSHLKQTVRFLHLLKGLQTSKGKPEDLFSSLEAFDFQRDQQFRDTALNHLTATLGAEAGLVSGLNRARIFPISTEPPVNHALEALDKLSNCVKLAQFLGVGAEALPRMIAEDYADLSEAVAIIVTAIRTKYDTEDAYQQKINPFEDKIREQRRDALTDSLIHTLAPNIFQTTNDLYHYFLIDTELEGCARTSRVVAGISSLQLYIQRCLMNLEQSQDGQIHVLPKDIPANEWEWRKNYRVWEANRKVFLYPENYIEPDLRDDKTPLFKELESELLQQEINAQTVLDAYAKYMKGFEEIARLKIAGAYHDRANGVDVLHLFGVTSSEPPEYYYRAIENIYKAEEPNSSKGIIWNPWQKVNLQIAVQRVSPIVYRGKLYVFWVEIITNPQNNLIDGNSTFIGYKHTLKIQFSSLKLDGNWTPPQVIDFTENAIFRDGVGVVMDLLRSGSIPTYGTDAHPQPRDDYKLVGYQWDQVYPNETNMGRLALVARNFRVRGFVDIYELKLGSPLELVPPRRILRGSFQPNDKRLYYSRNQIGYGFPSYIDLGKEFAQAELIKHSRFTGFTPANQLLTLEGAELSEQLLLIGGKNTTDGFLNINGDWLYLHSADPSGLPYAIKRISTTLSELVAIRLFEFGIDGLLDIDFQANFLKERHSPVSINERQVISDISLFSEGRLDTKGSLGVYFREILFHIPFLIANHLNSQGKYADAQRWYHYIFDPTSNKLPTDPARKADRVWQYIEFRNHTLQTLRDQLNDRTAEEAYKNDPFNPHAIARLRLGAYQKSIVMKYIDNLLDWGDHLFAQDTMESINEATLLYVMAADLLGARPIELGECDEKRIDKTSYKKIEEHINLGQCLSFVGETENIATSGSRSQAASKKNRDRGVLAASQLGYAASLAKAHPTIANQFFINVNQEIAFAETTNLPTLNVDLDPNQLRNQPYFRGIDWNTDKPLDFLPSFSTSLLKQACVFCIPPNPDLLGYWDRVDDRLYKIRNCLNISGIRRQLPLFAPEIDPRLLVRAKAAGISLEDVLNSISGNLPPYRFSFLIVKAKEYAGALQSFGAALLGAIEKKEAEELARLRLVHQDTILKLTTKLRDQEIVAAEANLESLQRRKTIIENRKTYYQELISQGLNSWESQQLDLMNQSFTIDFLASPLYIASGIVGAIPRRVGTCNSTGSEEGAETLKFFAESIRTISNIMQRQGGIAGIQGSNKRREQSWQFSLQQTNDELQENEKQIQAAEIRRDISIESRKIHETTLEQSQEIFEFYRDKFTNLGLYTWLSTQLQRLYREAYQNAMTVARLAEKAYRFERGDDTTFLLDGNYWDSSHAGLLAGDKLMNALRQMERLYMETHYRSLEIDQAFSLTQINPAALIRLKQTGECEFSIPELYFDLFYPGHYRRRIKSARLTIPCITGPYTNVSATLTLTGSKIRKDPVLGSENLFDVPPTRSVSIATSTAQNDSGVFRLDFRDERYMPFEGAGAVESNWKLTLPKNFRQFDYQTINDVILHISYTAEEDGVFRQQIEGTNAEAESEIRSFLQNNPLRRVFSLRQEFSNPFNRLIRSPINQPVALDITEKRFPIFLQGAWLSSLQITSAKVILVTSTPDNIGDFSMSIDGISLDFNTDEPFGGLPTDELDSWVRSLTETLLGEHTLVINNAGNLAPTSPAPSDPSAIDSEKLNDILIYLEYGL